MTAAFAFVLRNWQAFAGLIAVAILSTLLAIRTDQRDDARNDHAAAVARHRTFVAEVTAKAEGIRSTMAQHALRVERAQSRITEEVSRDYQNRIADVRARAERLRQSGAAARSAGGGSPDLPGLPDAAGGSDATAGAGGLSLADRVIATEQAIRLEELQRWVREQASVDRTATTDGR